MNGVLLRVRELYTLRLGSLARTASLGAGGARHSGCAIVEMLPARCAELVEKWLSFCMRLTGTNVTECIR